MNGKLGMYYLCYFLDSNLKILLNSVPSLKGHRVVNL